MTRRAATTVPLFEVPPVEFWPPLYVRVCHVPADGQLERREPDGRPGRARERADRDLRGLVRDLRLPVWPLRIRRQYLGVYFLPGAGELAIFCVALAGAALGFLWFNALSRREVFMGDTGSLAHWRITRRRWPSC